METNPSIQITEAALRAIVPNAAKSVDVFVPYLNKAITKYGIKNIPEFIAQCAHESMGFHYTKEIASGREYEGRIDLGNTEPGDGIKYKGRGIIQITGKANYKHCSYDMFGDATLLVNPQLLETPQYACLSAGWFWQLHKLDDYDFKTVTERINGSLNGYEDRLQYLERAKTAFA